MRFLEYQGKELFRSAGIPVPPGRVATTPEESEKTARELGGPVVIKAQVPIGGRGKAGGISLAETAGEAAQAAARLLGSILRGYPVKEVLVEKRVEMDQELYLGVTIDAKSGKRVFMACQQGGIEIEEIVSRYPHQLHTIELYPSQKLYEHQARTLFRRAGYRGKVLTRLADVAVKLFNLSVRYDLKTCEINPLGLTAEDNVIAADAKVEMDDNALYRHPQFRDLVVEELDPLEREARGIGVTYVRLDGEVGVVSSGAGLGMTTMDLLADVGLRPANFLETGGGITKDLMANAIRLVAKHEQVNSIIINLYGGVNPMIEAAHGIREAKRSLPENMPIVAKVLGNQQEEAWRLLDEAGVVMVKSPRTEDAVEVLKELLGGRRHEHLA